MEKRLLSLAAALVLAASPALAGLSVGDRAFLPEVKEARNIASVQPRDLEGKVILYEIFRTW